MIPDYRSDASPSGGQFLLRPTRVVPPSIQPAIAAKGVTVPAVGLGLGYVTEDGPLDALNS